MIGKRWNLDEARAEGCSRVHTSQGVYTREVSGPR